MDATRWQKIEEIFNATLSLPHPEREVFLNSACRDDTALRRELDLLLTEAEHPDQFLSESTFALGAQILSSSGPEASAGDKLENYRVVRPIGRGGMGEVYLAQDESLGRRVAIKLLLRRVTEDKERVRRFKHEARTASAISDPNVAHVYEIGEADGRLFIVMEYVPGSTLRELLSRQQMPVGQAIDIASQVCSAIAAAHARGIIHRDIKPENIIIRPDGLVKVVDFGLAKLSEFKNQSDVDDSEAIQLLPHITEIVETQPGLLLGTTTYMSPEQARGQNTDRGTDIWSWGVVFYEMLTGQAPFKGVTNSDVIAELLKSDPSFDLPIFKRLPQCVTMILRCALSKDRDQRYRKISEVGLAMRALQSETEAAGLLDLVIATGEIALLSEIASPGLSQSAEPRLLDTRTSVQPNSSPQLAMRAFFRRRQSLVTLVALIPILAVLLLTWPGHFFRKQVKSGTLQIIHLTDDGRIMDAAISPDGKLLAYVPIAGGKQSLRLRNLDSGYSWELLPPDPALCWGMRFALNNQSLFYISKQPGSTVSVLYRMPVRGGQAQKLVVNIDSPPGLSPDNMQLAFVRSYPGQHRDALIIANVDGSEEREILSRAHPDRLALSGVTWSPDGKMIAAGASRRDETEAAVLGVPVSGGTPIELTPWNWSAILGVVWKNNGRTILFSAHSPGSNALPVWRVSYPDRAVDRLTTDDNQYEEATLGPNVLVATHTYEVADLWMTEESSDRIQYLTTDNHNGADGLSLGIRSFTRSANTRRRNCGA
jgi:serine/threonine protein kinase